MRGPLYGVIGEGHWFCMSSMIGLRVVLRCHRQNIGSLGFYATKGDEPRREYARQSVDGLPLASHILGPNYRHKCRSVGQTGALGILKPVQFCSFETNYVPCDIDLRSGKICVFVYESMN